MPTDIIKPLINKYANEKVWLVSNEMFCSNTTLKIPIINAKSVYKRKCSLNFSFLFIVFTNEGIVPKIKPINIDFV